MKFSSTSAAAILAALSVVQAAPLSAPSSDMTAPHNKMLRAREDMADVYAEDVRKLKVRWGSLDQDHSKREALDRRQDNSSGRGDTTHGEDSDQDDEDTNPADIDGPSR
ncbi:hypothetical protein LZ31DRAFT_599450 [Colletotrichum somersetense]|nr:hypothetical protein LZ31DRAFT_599450 [Colletotrichum somersetense]